MEHSILILALFTFFTLSCQERKADYTPGNALSMDQQQSLVASVIRYTARPPEKAHYFESRFNAQYDEHYAKAAKAHTLEAYHKSADGYEYILLSRTAPSIHLKKVAIGIQLKRNADNQPEYYREVFRTWKFPENEMKQKGLMLFDLMVKGKDLTRFYPQNSGAEEYIEFPDEHTRFDVDQKRWVSDLEVLKNIDELKNNILESKENDGDSAK